MQPRGKSTARAINPTASLSRLGPHIPPAKIARMQVRGILIRCLHAGGNTIGAISFEGLRDSELTAGALSALAAAMLERTRTFRNASQATAAAQAESFRGAILDALAHEFKTPLATIVTAAGGLRELGPLRVEQLELTDIVETEASRLSLLTSRLLRAAQVDREDIKPRLEFTNMADLVTVVADQFSRQWTDRKLVVRKRDRIPGLWQTANYCSWLCGNCLTMRANIPSLVPQLWSTLTRRMSGLAFGRQTVEVRFDRVSGLVFSSGSTAGRKSRHKAPGSGLGLYVARRIVHAHGGSLDLEMATKTQPETAFRLALPRTRTVGIMCATVDHILSTRLRAKKGSSLL